MTSEGSEARLTGRTSRSALAGVTSAQAEANLKTFAKYRFERLVVFGPHEYNAFRNEYPKLGGEFRVPLRFSFRKSILDCDVLPIDVTELTQTLPEPLNADRIRRGREQSEITYPRDFLCLLRLGQ